MAQTSISIRMDETLKTQAENLFSELGMNMTTAITVFARQAVRQQKIPFDVTANPFWSAENQKRLGKAMADMEMGRNCAVHELIEDAYDENLA
jgi:DNA-damage-inducible protein J